TSSLKLVLSKASRPSGPRRTSRRLRHESDTVHLLERGLAAAHGVEGGVAQEARAVARRGVLQVAGRRARDDQLADLVVHHQQLGDRLAPAVTGAAAFAAA